MATHQTLTSLFSDIADSIREKTGDTSTIVADDFPTEIANIPSGGTSLFTGHYDAQGLKTIGWSDEEIQYYQDNGVLWDEKYDDVFKLNTTELAGDDSSETRFIPKNTTKRSFSNYNYLLAIPQFNMSSAKSFSSMFNGCRSLTTIPELDTSSGTNFSYMLSDCYGLTTIPELDTSSGTNFSNMFKSCYKLTTIPELDTSSGTIFSNMFDSCRSLTTIPELDTSSGTNFSNMFNSCSGLRILPLLDLSNAANIDGFVAFLYILLYCGGFINLGKAYLTTASANYKNYTLSLNGSNCLTEQSLINILNNLYDIATKGVATQKCTLGSTNLAKLTSAEGQQALLNAQMKGWTIS